MNEKIMKQEATYDWLKDEVHCLNDEMNKLQKRIDEAILYVEWQRKHPQYDNIWRDFECDGLINILKGSEDDE